MAGILIQTPLLGQSSANASSTVIVLEPASIVKIADLNFGYIIPGSTSGTVRVVPSDGSRTKTGGVNFTSFAGPVSRATFTVSASSKYQVTLPTNTITLTREGGTETMTVSTFTVSPIYTKYPTNITTLYVGASLNIGANQVGGEYVSNNTFIVHVNLP